MAWCAPHNWCARRELVGQSVLCCTDRSRHVLLGHKAGAFTALTNQRSHHFPANPVTSRGVLVRHLLEQRKDKLQLPEDRSSTEGAVIDLQ